ncbi:MAG TPA: TRAP transporter substrate-binding protein [Acetobacteraceae bacterium]
MRVALAMLAILALLRPAAAQPVTLKLSHFLGPASFFQTDFAEPWARELEARTGGRVRVEIFNGASPLGGVGAQAEQVLRGETDIALGLRGAEGERFPRSGIIELPFTVSDALSGSRALWRLHRDGALGDEFGAFKLLALFVHNPGLVHTARKRVVTPEDIRGLRLRAPNKAAAEALASIGALPAILQVNEVMPAVVEGRLDGIVTNWGNPLPGFNDAMKHHTDLGFYTSAFFVVMNKARFAALPADIREAIEAQSNEALVDRFGMLWSKWDAPVREGANAPGHEVIMPDAATLALWRAALRPVTERYLAGLAAGGFTEAPAVHARLLAR